MPKFIKLSIICLLLINVFSVGILTVGAEGLLPDRTGPDCPDSSTNCGNYTLNDMASAAVKISTFILGLVGSLALLAFIVGGLMWLLSAGNPEWVTRGKQAIIGAVVGLVIVFTSYMIIQLVFSALGVPGAEQGGWSISSWFKSENNTSSTDANSRQSAAQQAYEQCFNVKNSKALSDRDNCLNNLCNDQTDSLKKQACLESCYSIYYSSTNTPFNSKEECNLIYNKILNGN
ncbi:MAG: pilin [bacterium]|nr:pilin [bacterium]